MANKKVVLLHGSDPDQADTPWMFYHLHPSSYGSTPVLSEGKTFDLVYFDFEQDKLTTWRDWTAKRDRHAPAAAPASSTDIKPKAKIRDSNGAEYPGEPEHPTVVGFYDWVKAQPAHSIASIQVFSHAIIPQPVLFALSWEWGDDPDKKRDQNAARDARDTEFRLRDFSASNPLGGGDPWSGTGGELAKFKAALDPDCFIKIWGCGEQTHTHNDGDPIRKLLTDWLKVKDGPARAVRRAQLLLSYLDHVKNFFPYRLAEALEIPVWAGPVGWGSDPYDVDGTYDPKTYARDKFTWVGKFPPRLDKKELWWRVSKGFRANKGLSETIFKRTLKARLDPMGYVEYTPSWVRAADKAMNDIVNPRSGDSFFGTPANITDQLRQQIQRLIPTTHE